MFGDPKDPEDCASASASTSASSASTSEPQVKEQAIDFSRCSFSSTPTFLDEVIPPTEQNKYGIQHIIDIMDLENIDLSESFDWAYSLLTIFTKICNRVADMSVKESKAFYPFTKESHAFYSGQLDRRVSKNKNQFVDAVLSCMDDHTRRYRSKITMTSSFITLFFVGLFETHSARHWVEPLEVIKEGLSKEALVWQFHSPAALQRIIFGNAGELSPYLWYEVMLCRTYGAQARDLCRVFKYLVTAGYHSIQAMFDTLCEGTLFVPANGGNYISKIMVPWITCMPPFWPKKWDRVVFYNHVILDDADMDAFGEEMNVLFGLPAVSPCITEVYIDTLGDGKLHKFTPGALRNKNEIPFRLNKRPLEESSLSLPSSSSSSSPQSFEDTSSYKKKLRRRD